MKKLWILLICLFAYSSTHAGLFEYHQTGCNYGANYHHDYWNGNCNSQSDNSIPSHWNTDSHQNSVTNSIPGHWTNNSHSDPDVIESSIPSHWDTSSSSSRTIRNSTPSHWDTNSSNYNSNSSYYHTWWSYNWATIRSTFNHSYNGYDRYTPSYYDIISKGNGYYGYEQLRDYYQSEQRKLEREARFIDDLKRDIKLNIRDLKKYNSRYYNDIKNSLNRELDIIEDREAEVERLIKDLEKEIKNLKKNKSRSKSKYYNYYNAGTYFDSWHDRNSYYYRDHSDRNYYDYDDYYYNRNYYKYDYNKGEFIPHWVNPDLKPIKDGHIYVR